MNASDEAATAQLDAQRDGRSTVSDFVGASLLAVAGGPSSQATLVGPWMLFTIEHPPSLIAA